MANFHLVVRATTLVALALAALTGVQAYNEPPMPDPAMMVGEDPRESRKVRCCTDTTTSRCC